MLHILHKFIESNLDFALNELSRAGWLLVFDDKVETILTALTQGQHGNLRNVVQACLSFARRVPSVRSIVDHNLGETASIQVALPNSRAAVCM
jgi:hypothetical protein